MTTLGRLKLLGKDFYKDLFAKRRDADENRQNETAAAIKMQSWYRGYRVRAYVRHLNQCACTIQRIYRGHIGRGVYRKKLLVQLELVRQLFYDQCATTIQKRWRGYYTRKYIFNFYARKAYLEALQENNTIIRTQLENVRLQEERRKTYEKENKIKAQKLLTARQNHYLISTYSIPSIYTSPHQRDSLLQHERELREVQPLSASERETMNERKWLSMVESGVVDLYSTRPSGHEQSKVLPPLRTKKPQGPFRDSARVRTQRHKPLCPTLRVATSYNSVEDAQRKFRAEEWTKRIHDDRLLFSKAKEVYQPMLHKESSYIRPSYGTKHFRDEDTAKHISKEPFKRLVSPIPIFDQLGKTY